MNNSTELREAIRKAWRLRVKSYWQRGAIFFVLETVAIAGYWRLISDPAVPPSIDAVLTMLGIAVTAVWWLSDQTARRYIDHWSQSLFHLNDAASIQAEQKTFLLYRDLVRALPVVFLLAWALPLCFRVGLPSLCLFRQPVQVSPDPNAQYLTYFDAHNHGFGAILPYYAYADLNAFIKNPTDPEKVDLKHRRDLWQSLVRSHLGDKSSLTGPENRYAPGASATLRAYGTNIANLTSQQINGALQRVLTTTPWTEFDSAYAFRSGPVDKYLSGLFKDDGAQRQAVCDASILELALTKTAYSEQFLSFVGGWGSGYSPLDAIRCFHNEPKALAASGQLKDKTVPIIKALLMTYTSDLGATPDGKHWRQFGTSGQCDSAELRERTFGDTTTWLSPPPKVIETALLGKDFEGNNILLPGEQPGFFDEVIGIDTAGPEITCFTPSGMENYKKLVRTVYDAARTRRKLGWHGKLLVHTHVGEGSATYLLKNVPEGDQAKNVFTSFPEIWMDPVTGQPVHSEQAEANVKMLIGAVKELRSDICDLDDYVVLRFGHVTHTDRDDALAMKKLNIEADINLESNISTRAFYPSKLATSDPGPLTESQQFADNDIADQVLSRADAVEILSDHALKNILAAGVRTLLGSDGGGEENSDIGREYSLAQQLIGYWSSHDKAFPQNLSIDTINRNVEEHLKEMQTDHKVH